MKPEKAGDYSATIDYSEGRRLCPMIRETNCGVPFGMCAGPACAWYDRAADRCAVLSLARGKRA